MEGEEGRAWTGRLGIRRKRTEDERSWDVVVTVGRRLGCVVLSCGGAVWYGIGSGLR